MPTPPCCIADIYPCAMQKRGFAARDSSIITEFLFVKSSFFARKLPYVRPLLTRPQLQEPSSASNSANSSAFINDCLINAYQSKLIDQFLDDLNLITAQRSFVIQSA